MSTRNRRSSTRNKSSPSLSSPTSSSSSTADHRTANSNPKNIIGYIASDNINVTNIDANINVNHQHQHLHQHHHDHSEEVTSTTIITTEVIDHHEGEIIIKNDDDHSNDINLKRNGSNNVIRSKMANNNIIITDTDSNNSNSNNNIVLLGTNNDLIRDDIISNNDENASENDVYTLTSTKDAISVIKETSSLTSTATIGDTIVAVVPVIQTITGNQIQVQQSASLFNPDQLQLTLQRPLPSPSSSSSSSPCITIPTTASTIIHEEITKALAINTKAPLRVIVTTETRPGPSGSTPTPSSSTILSTPLTPTTSSTATSTLSSSGSGSSAQNNCFEAADSNSGNTPSKSFVQCKVCGDKASGYHYGVTSCEGCKGFFRRSIQKQIEYKCLRDGKCLVIRLNRNRCQYCRFKKCLAVGMSRDSVRYGRVPKRSREKGDDNRVTTSETEQSREAENVDIAMYEIIRTISSAHHLHCAYTDDSLKNMMRKPAIFSLDEYNSSPSECSPSSVTADSLEQQKINMWQRFADFITPSISRVVEFAKRIPGFLELSQDDQLILIKSGFFEIWLLHVAKMVNPIDNTLTFADGNYITRQQMELMFDHEFVASIFNFTLSLNQLRINDVQVGLVAAIVLVTTDRYGIYDAKAIHRIQEKLYEALRVQISRDNNNDITLYQNIVMKLPELRSLGIKHAEHLSWFRGNWTRLKLPPLFAEIFDIPKSEDELLLVAQ